MSRRNLTIQTPGETAQTEPQANASQIQTPGETGNPDAGGGASETQESGAEALLAAQDELKAANQRIQELEAEAAVRAASKSAPASTVKTASVRDYSRTPSSEIDATKLTAPVLSADGWVTPNTAEKKA